MTTSGGYLACATLSVWLLVGCAVAPTPDKTPELTAAELASYESLARSKELATQVGVVEEELIRRCMVAKGNRWRVPYSPSNYVYEPYKSLEVAEAAEYGYSTLTLTPEARLSDQESQLFDDSLTDAEREKQYVDLAGGAKGPKEWIVMGEGKIEYPASGCRYETQQQLYGDVKAWHEVFFAVMQINAASQKAERSPEKGAIAKRWSKCVAEGSRNYQEPGDAILDGMEASTRHFTDEQGYEASNYEGPTPKEIEIAVADAKCRAETGYDATMRAATKKAIAQEAAAHEGEILKLLEIYTAAEGRARELLG
ncbi:MAG: hypothetical protein QM713_13275 [Arachnia sp.]